MKIAVIGGGIAGVSAAFAVARHPSGPEVVLVEAEARLAQHTTGRSAAQLIENYGAAPNRTLTAASLGFFADPPEELVDTPLLSPRPQLTVATETQSAALDDALAAGGGLVQEVDHNQAISLFGALEPTAFVRAMVEPSSADIDVAALHQAFVRGLRQHGASIRLDARVDRISRASHGWDLGWADAGMGADVIVNAAGAWGDVVAELAGMEPVGLQPKRRTAFMVSSPVGVESADWALVADVDHTWYCKPDGPQFLCSPADETPSDPCDAKPEETDVALAIERINTATTLGIRSVASAWAGLRTFVDDGAMVIGPDPADAAFIWAVGQGGTGIQTSPGAGDLVAALVMGERPPPGVDVAGLSPARTRQ